MAKELKGGRPINLSNQPGCIIALSAPVFLAGAFLIEQSMFGRGERSALIGLGVFGGILFLVGGLILAAGVTKIRAARREQLRRDAHPVEPWRWTGQWDSPDLADINRNAAVFSWTFAILFNAIAWPAAYAAIHAANPGNHAVYFVLLLPAATMALLAWAIYLTVRRMKFGRCTLHLETLPGCIGGYLAGTIETPRPIHDANSVRLVLRCIQRTTTNSFNLNSGRSHRRAWDEPLWEKEQKLTGVLPQGIPVSFRIPPDRRATEKFSARDEILWRLSVHADTPGADFSAEFLVPIFHAEAAQPKGFIPEAEKLAAKLRATSSR
jgi:hypothetical protein